MADKTLSVVEETPRASAIIHAPPKGKMAFSGDGPDRLLCGSCTVILAEGVSEGQLIIRQREPTNGFGAAYVTAG